MTAIAFALAGLGGFNAHGAGFLTAATHRKVVPELVTATSGQIVILADWFRNKGEGLEKAIVDATLERNPSAQLSVALSGYSHVFRPAYLETVMRWWSPPSTGEFPVKALLDRLMPAQVYVPTRTPEEFATMAATLNEAAAVDGRPVGVVFNTYNLKTGEAVLFGNDRARELWPRARNIPNATRPVTAATSGSKADEPLVHPITAESLRSALWLSLYGFDRLPEPHLIDGAYHRSCLVSELHRFDRVFVARPLAAGWSTRPPANWFEVQDWQTEMWFSVGYKAEVDALNQVNGLVKDGHLGDPFKFVHLHEVAPNTPAGYSNYFVERQRIFKDAYKMALAKFEEALGPADPTPP